MLPASVSWPVTFTRSLPGSEACPTTPGTFSSKFEFDPATRFRLATVSVPGLFPGARLPPSWMETAPPIVPLPPSVAPVCTVTAVAPSEPFTRSVPFVTVVAPV